MKGQIGQQCFRGANLGVFASKPVVSSGRLKELDGWPW